MRRLAIAYIVAVPLSAFGGERNCPPGNEMRVYGLSTPADDLARVAELSGAVDPSPRLIRRGGDRTETVCADVAFPWPAFARPVSRPEAFPPSSVRPERSGGGAAAESKGAEASGLEQDRGADLRAIPFRLVSVWSSTYPAGDNDGLLWSGRGLSQLASAGISFRWRALSLAIAPEATWSENRFFDTLPNGRTGAQRFGTAYYPGQIDLPQRFGAGPYVTWAPGQSYLRLDYWNVAVGLSSENLWIGPGIRSSILLSNAGPGFPHAFVGTSRPADIWIGKAEALAYWGRLDRSEFAPAGGHPLITGLAITYEPRWVPGLYVGAHRYFVQPWDGLTLRDYLPIFQSLRKESLATAENPIGDNPRDNQIASLFARWAFPQAGLEIYGEWAREDHAWSWWSFIREPDHSQAYLVGLQKTFRAGAKLVRLHAELTNLQEMAGFASRFGLPVYYIHGNDLDLTNRGQLLGSWLGPGGSSQTLAVDVFHAGGRIGGYLERVRREDAYYWSVIEPDRPNWTHDTEIAGGVRQVLSVGLVEVSWEAAAAYRQNRDFIRHEPNLKFVLGLSMPITPASAAARPGVDRSPAAP